MKILATAHDAGGANQLIHKFMGNQNVDFILTGPASEIANTLGVKHNSSFDFENVTDYDIVFAGSNSTKQLSDHILNCAIGHGLKTVGVLEHWVNYSSRWEITPDRVEVQDLRALLGGFVNFGVKIRFSRNHYFEYLDSRTKKSHENHFGLLVILQPINGKFSHAGLNSCFCLSIEKLLKANLAITKIKLRQHVETPAELCISHLTSTTGLEITTTTINQPIEKDFDSCFFVLGLDSYALYLAKKIGKKVFSISVKKRSWFSPKYTAVP